MTVGKLKALLESVDDDAEITYVNITDFGQGVTYVESEVEYIEAKVGVSSGVVDEITAELIIATDGGVEVHKTE